MKTLCLTRADIVHLCSSSPGNISEMEFHLVGQNCTNLCSCKLWSCCFCFSAFTAVVLSWKWDTRRLADVTTWLICWSLNLWFIVSCSECAKAESPIHATRCLLASCCYLALSCTHAMTFLHSVAVDFIVARHRFGLQNSTLFPSCLCNVM